MLKQKQKQNATISFRLIKIHLGDAHLRVSTMFDYILFCNFPQR